MQNFVNTRRTPQTQKIPGSDQVENSAGGFTYQITDLDRARRFLILGTEGGSYYASQNKLSYQNFDCLKRLLKTEAEGIQLVDLIRTVSDEGLAPKNDPALFALAVCTVYGTPFVKQFAYRSLPYVARIPTHLFHFAQYRKDLGGGWGTGMRKAVARFYTDRPVASLTNMVTKYKQRDGWSNRDLLRLSHPDTDEAERKAVFDWVCRQGMDNMYATMIAALPDKIKVIEGIQSGELNRETILGLIEKYNLPREVLPTEMLNDKDVWMQLLPHMGPEAMIRNLRNMAKKDVLVPMSKAEKIVVGKLQNEDLLKKARIHPFFVLNGLIAYSEDRDGNDYLWSHMRTPKPDYKVSETVRSALEDAFYSSFKNVPVSGKNFYLGIDVSGSMGFTSISERTPITAAEGAAVMAMATVRAEPWCYMAGFCNQMKDLKINKNDSLETVLEKTDRQNFGMTDCAMPMVDALKKKMDVDVFVIYTDNETYAGNIHPTQALDEYNKKMGKNAKLIVVGMTSTGFSIADPARTDMLDLVGFDASAPNVISNFAAGNI